jgi:hypothetical protein
MREFNHGEYRGAQWRQLGFRDLTTEDREIHGAKREAIA